MKPISRDRLTALIPINTIGKIEERCFSRRPAWLRLNPRFAGTSFEETTECHAFTSCNMARCCAP